MTKNSDCVTVLIGSGTSSMLIQAGKQVSIDEELEKRFPTKPKQKIKVYLESRYYGGYKKRKYRN